MLSEKDVNKIIEYDGTMDKLIALGIMERNPDNPDEINCLAFAGFAYQFVTDNYDQTDEMTIEMFRRIMIAFNPEAQKLTEAEIFMAKTTYDGYVLEESR